MEYRVYAEDPSRKFLPSIGFLQKYKEPRTDRQGERIRIDTGVQEGSEISMYYDPMISKLITWGKTREEAMKLMDRAFDEYVIEGVTHNIGFGKSILANPAYAKGDYSTAFIPKYYPQGFSGDNLTPNDHTLLSIAAHNVKNYFSSRGKTDFKPFESLFVTIEAVRDQPAVEFQICKVGPTDFKIKNLSSGHETTHKLE
jgi:propionyl-CoA carboxylase alpha chain